MPCRLLLRLADLLLRSLASFRSTIESQNATEESRLARCEIQHALDGRLASSARALNQQVWRFLIRLPASAVRRIQQTLGGLQVLPSIVQSNRPLGIHGLQKL